MTKETKAFLEENVPEILGMNSINVALDLLYEMIDLKGFAPPSYEEYNDFGRQAQKAYNDLFTNN